jgi:hypothetical protein
MELGQSYTYSNLAGLNSNEYALTHFPPSSSDIYDQIHSEKLRVIFNFRDPRDACVSKLNWHSPENKKITNLTREYLKKVYAKISYDDLLSAIIKGDKYLPHDIVMSDLFRCSRGLLLHPHPLKVRFEDLVGAKGGGSTERQLRAIASVAKYLGIEATDAMSVSRNVFDEQSDTFHKGQIGAYKKVFKQIHFDSFTQLHQDILDVYGYK